MELNDLPFSDQIEPDSDFDVPNPWAQTDADYEELGDVMDPLAEGIAQLEDLCAKYKVALPDWLPAAHITLAEIETMYDELNPDDFDDEDDDAVMAELELQGYE